MLVIAFYKFVSLPDYEELREPLLKVCKENEIKGTILLAPEGINGTIVGLPEGIRNLLAWLQSDDRLADLEHKESYISTHDKTFYRMKVRLKKEIVTLGLSDIDPTDKVGTYVEPDKWNELINDPEVILIDTRNDYEVEIGSFKGAIDPHTKSFSEFPEWVRENLDSSQHRKVAMFCTGGIRCEKATSFMLKEGFEEVYHLKGGILKYLEAVNEEESTWEGECYVFDHRVAVDHSLSPGSYDLCYACRRPLSDEDKDSPDYTYGISCHRCVNEFSEGDRLRFAERARQIELAGEQGKEHLRDGQE